METNNIDINLTILRQKNENFHSKWLFPIRMENTKEIKWVANIVECLGKFKKPIERTTWEHLLRQKTIRAQTPEEQQLLEQWWDKGWAETPQLPTITHWGNPILRIGLTGMGETLEVVYPTLTSAGANMKLDKRRILGLCTGKFPNPDPTMRLMMLRKSSDVRAVVKGEKQKPWTLFAANNTILGFFDTKQQMADFLGISPRSIDWAHQKHWNQLEDGKWVWLNQWGLVPISPADKALECDWRTRYAPEKQGEVRV